MPYKVIRTAQVLRGIAVFVAVLAAFVALSALAQMPRGGAVLEEVPTLSAPPKASFPAPPLLHPRLFQANGRAERTPESRSQRRESAGDPMASDPLVFLFFPSVFYDFGGVAGSVAASLVAKDVNGDGKPDLVGFGNLNVYGRGGLVGVFLGNGDGTFQPVVNYGSGGYGVRSGAVADVNGDGKPDIVVANCSNANDLCQGITSVGVLLGNGDGTFRTAVTYDSRGQRYQPSLAVADVNGDQKPDVLVATIVCFNISYCDYAPAISVLLGNGDGTFQAAQAYPSGGSQSNSVAVADVNGDGQPDLLVSNCNQVNSYCDANGSVGVLLGNGDGTFQPVVNYDSGGGATSFTAVGDVNGDHKPDLLAANPISNNVGVLLGNGDGTFQTAVTYNARGQFSPVGAFSLELVDVNGDAKPDLVLSSAGVGVMLGNGDGTFRSVITYNPGQGGEAIAVADMNGDGKPDVAATSHGVGVLLNNDGAPATTTSLVSSVNPVTVNQEVTYTATVMPRPGETVKGTVWFMESDYPVGMVTLEGNQAALSLSYTYIRAHPITAIYSGDLNNASASISNTLTESVRGITRVVVTTSGSPSLVGQPLTFTAAIRSRYGSVPNGELVTFADGKTPLASVVLSGGSATYTTSALWGGPHPIKATYAGDATLAPSTGGFRQIVNKYPTTTALSSSSKSSAYGQAVTFLATVTPTGLYPLTGKVKFWDDTLAIGSATLNGGAASLTTSKLLTGTHLIKAQYLGDAANDKSTSSVLKHVVQ